MLPLILQQGFRLCSLSAEHFPKKGGYFPKLSRTLPEEMGCFPEELPKTSRRKVQDFCKNSGSRIGPLLKKGRTCPEAVCHLSAT
jgi:hypothetical protein